MAVIIRKEVRFQLPEEPIQISIIPIGYEGMANYLKSVFREKKEGNEQAYYQLLDSLRSRNEMALNRNQKMLLIRGLSLFVSSLDLKMFDLVTLLLSLDWLDQDQPFIACYMHFLQNLVSAQATFVLPVSAMLIENLVSGNQFP